jgi:heme iron utilization protein
MAQVNKSQGPDRVEIAADARSLVRRAFKGSLATLSSVSGYPYASLITLATDAAGAPTFLISTLALHTRNLAHDPRCSILIDATGALADPLQGARVTLYGRAEKSADEGTRRRFLARHEEAAFYADFPDFAFWRLAVEGAHYIGGFGRIVDLAASELVLDPTGAEALIESEPGIIAHMNDDHADAIELYALCSGGERGPWRMTGIDPEGCDIMLGHDARRIVFAHRIMTPGEARKELVRLAAKARDATNAPKQASAGERI